jgi:membrane protease YdiL (CAAX protease family)
MSAPLPSTPASASSRPPAPRRTGSPLAGFLIDLGLSAALLFALSFLAWIVWGVVQSSHVSPPTAPGELQQAVPALGKPGALAQLLMALAGTGGAALIVYFWRRRASAEEQRRSVQAVRQPGTWGWTVLVGVLVIVGSNGIAFLARQAGIEPVPTNLALMNRAWDQFPLFLTLFAVLLAPAYEELLFRRILFGRLWQAGRPLLGAVLSSLAFALIHELPGTSGNGPMAIAQLWLIYGGMGAAFCWLYQRTGTLWAPIAAHGLNNAVALAALALSGTV